MSAKHPDVFARHPLRSGARWDETYYRRQLASRSECRNIGGEIDILQIRVDVQRLCARLARAIARLFHTTERHVRLTAERAGVYDDDAALNPAHELHRPVHAPRVNARGESVG